MIYIFLAIWLYTLIHCFRRKDLRSVFSSVKKTRFFWFCTLLIADPWVMVYYFFYNRESQLNSPYTKKLKYKVIGIITILLAYSWVPFKDGSSIKTYSRVDDKMVLTEGRFSPWISLGLRAYISKRELTSTSTLGQGELAPLNCRNIALIARSPHPAVHALGHQLQKELKKLEFVQSIEFTPYGHSSDKTKVYPDLILGLDIENSLTIRLPGATFFKATFHIDSDYTPERIVTRDISFYGLLGKQYGCTKSVRTMGLLVGFENAANKYSGVASNISGSLKIAGDLKKTAEEHEALTEFPPEFDCVFEELSIPEPLKKMQEVKKIRSGNYPFLHNVTAWEFKGSGDYWAVRNQLQDEFKNVGWVNAGGSLSYGDLYLKKGDEYFFLRKLDHRGFTTFNFEFDSNGLTNVTEIVEKETRFVGFQTKAMNQKETQAKYKSLFNSDLSREQIKVVAPLISKKYPMEALTLLDKTQLQSVDHYLLKARLFEEIGDPPNALREFKKAFILRKMSDNSSKYDFERTQKYLGLEEEIKLPVEEDIYLNLQFIDFNSIQDSLTKELKVGESLFVYNLILEEGFGRSDRHLVQVQLVENPEKPSQPFVTLKFASTQGSSYGMSTKAALTKDRTYSGSANLIYDKNSLAVEVSASTSDQYLVKLLRTIW